MLKDGGPSRLLDRRIRADDLIFFLVLFWVSRAWIYVGDAQTQEQIDAPGLFFFQILVQCLCIWLFAAKLRLKVLWRFVFDNFFLFLFLILAFVLLPLSSVVWNSFGLLRAFVLFLVGCCYLSSRFDDSAKLRAFSSVSGVVVVMSLLTALLFSFGKADGDHLGSWRGLYSHKNGLGEMAAFSAIFFGALLYSDRRYKAVRWFFFLVSVSCLVMSGSATSLAATASALSLVFILKRISGIRIRGVYRGLLSIFVLLFVVFGVFLAVESAVDLVGRDLTFTGRTFIWEQYVEIGGERPFTGWGWTAASTNEDVVNAVREFVKLPYLRTTHSVYVQMFVEFGYLGFLLYSVWIVLTVFREFYWFARSGSPVNATRAGVAIGMFIIGFFESIVGFVPCMWLAFLLITTGGPTLAGNSLRRVA